MTDLSPEARALLEAAREGDSPTAADRARVRRALAVAVATGTASASASAAASKAALGSGAFAKGSVGWWLAAGVAAGVVTSAAVFTGFPASGRAPVRDEASNAHNPTTHVVTSAPLTTGENAAPRASVEEPPHDIPATQHEAQGAPHKPRQLMEPVAKTTPTSDPAPESTRAASTAALTEATPPARPSTPSTLGAETSLLQAARAALGRGDAGGALALLDQHEREFPRGVLVEERLATRVFALCAMGRPAEATPVATRLLQLFPASPLRARVLASCAAPR